MPFKPYFQFTLVMHCRYSFQLNKIKKISKASDVLCVVMRLTLRKGFLVALYGLLRPTTMFMEKRHTM